ncbi:MAG: ligand-binding protein SH3 [Proteobacteria bacterium]|nr:ligand-binding protein SH3 [Pseudomonadota bacterium]
MKTILILVLITLIPTLELRASIPFGILWAEMAWWSVVLVCVITNIVLGPLVYLFLDKVMVLLLRFPWLNRVYQRTVLRTRRKIERFVDRYGEIGVALFIGIPFPGTGSYSGALGAYLIGLGYRKFILANIIGVLMAGTIVTTIVLSGVEAFRIIEQPPDFIKYLKRFV